MSKIDDEFDMEFEEEYDDLDNEYMSWTVPKLKQALKHRELKTTGKKANLVQRLFDSDREKEKAQGIYTLNIKTLMGSFITIKINKDSTFGELKKMVAENRGVEPDKVRLHFISYGYPDGFEPKIGDLHYRDGMVGIQLDDNKSLEEQCVTEGAFFNLHIRLI